MADAISKVKVDKDFSISADQFRKHYLNEVLELLHDTDNLVKLKALLSMSKLVNAGYLSEETLHAEIWPTFLKMCETTFDEDQSNHFFSKSLG
jgi:hypothetical protein